MRFRLGSGGWRQRYFIKRIPPFADRAPALPGVMGTRMEQKIDILLGRRLRIRRRLMGLTQSQLALMVGVRFQQIQKYEAGANRISASRLWRFCQALGVPVAYFFEGLPSTSGQVEAPAAAEDDLMDRPESRDLIRAFHQLDERPRRRLLDLAKALNTGSEGVA